VKTYDVAVDADGAESGEGDVAVAVAVISGWLQ
jgi:hypothetical protein